MRAKRLLFLPALLLLTVSCTDRVTPTDLTISQPADAPSYFVGVDELKTVTYNGESLTFWPFTGRSPSRFDPADPMNLIFVGDNDPRAIRAALLFLDGNRPIPFDCTWTDAIGDVQTAFTDAGWTANAIQLQCGEYSPFRFHLRLWDVGDWTLGGGHLEVLIPGTTDHEVLNWEYPEALVALDLQRAGLVIGSAVSGPIFPSPYRAVHRAVYDALPDVVRALILGWPGIVPAQGDVPLLTDQQATILELAGTVASERVVAKQHLRMELNQTVPKPFCAPTPIHIAGPVRLDQTVIFTPSGNFISHFHAIAHIDVTPIDPQTGQPGEPYRALVNQTARGIITNGATLVSSFSMSTELPKKAAGHGTLILDLRVGPHGAVSYDAALTCN
jgi:hypothetical protein